MSPHQKPNDLTNIGSKRDSRFALHLLGSQFSFEHNPVQSSISDSQPDPEQEYYQSLINPVLISNANRLEDKLAIELDLLEDRLAIEANELWAPISTTNHHKTFPQLALRPKLTPIPELPEEEVVTKARSDFGVTNPSKYKMAIPAAKRSDFDAIINPQNALGICVDPRSPSSSPIRETESPLERTAARSAAENGDNEPVFKPFIPPGGSDWRGDSDSDHRSVHHHAHQFEREYWTERLNWKWSPNMRPPSKAKEWWERQKAWFQRRGHDLKEFGRKLLNKA